jgi:predicted alpha/beta-fold hydrolase
VGHAEFGGTTLNALSIRTSVIASNKGDLHEIVEKIGKHLIYMYSDELKEILTNLSRRKYLRYAIKTFARAAYIGITLN